MKDVAYICRLCKRDRKFFVYPLVPVVHNEQGVPYYVGTCTSCMNRQLIQISGDPTSPSTGF